MRLMRSRHTVLIAVVVLVAFVALVLWAIIGVDLAKAQTTGGTQAPESTVPEMINDHHECSADPPEVNLNCDVVTTVPHAKVQKIFRAKSFKSAARKGVKTQSAADFTLNFNYTELVCLEPQGHRTKRVRKYVATVHTYLYEDLSVGPAENKYDVRVVRLKSGKFRVIAKMQEPMRYLF